MEKTEGLIFKSVSSNKRSMKLLRRNVNNSAGLRTFSAAIAGLAMSSYDSDMITESRNSGLIQATGLQRASSEKLLRTWRSISTSRYPVCVKSPSLAGIEAEMSEKRRRLEKHNVLA
jgi:hypothetical protein